MERAGLRAGTPVLHDNLHFPSTFASRRGGLRERFQRDALPHAGSVALVRPNPRRSFEERTGHERGDQSSHVLHFRTCIPDVVYFKAFFAYIVMGYSLYAARDSEAHTCPEYG